ncbi:hypothetical protein GMST_02680 [Geomonas silvestris]|uniref:Glycosyltransferase 2-like domain-containing protein n=1 Tax=Geomonas silvestris TaxID=2740184 RepID=A0A6V8MDQ9_9BACT|nr:glycosyltransferase family 2 protein [Geomonas silvestris]GFO57943.1 hypothetical protein GMST_02680 [Geomonas silvestris]
MSTLPEPKVTIIVVNWNKRADVINLLDSLQGIAYKNYSIVVVDNASTDDSVPAIKAHPLSVTLLENAENLGGTGGFNTGMRYALNVLQQDYLWLLDNDAEVTPYTLTELVRAMEADGTIGAAGSCIMSPEDKSLMVEAGGFVHWRSGTWAPNLRYARLNDQDDSRIIDVDYVAACSALVRATTAREVGVMDDRYFLHWDDIEFCLRMKRQGLRVVAVVASKVYHGVEKGCNPGIIYYDFRNGLLTASKHTSGIGRLIAYLGVLNNAFSSMVYVNLLGHRAWSRLIRSSVEDFLLGRFGKGRLSAGLTVAESQPVAEQELATRLSRVLVYASGTFDEVVQTVTKVREVAPGAHITLGVNRERAPIFDFLNVSHLCFDILKDPLSSKIRTAIKVLCGGYGVTITAGEGLSAPYAFLLTKHYTYAPVKERFFASDQNLWAIWKVALSLVLGPISAVAALPSVWNAGTRHAGSGGLSGAAEPVRDSAVG